MKNTTKQIHNTLNLIEYIDMGLYESITDPRVKNIIHQETTLKEAFENIIYYKDLMLDIINSNIELFERIIPFSVRTNLNQWLLKIHQSATQIKNNPANFNIVNQYSTQFIQFVSALIQGLSPYNLDYHVKGSPNYQKKLTDINYLIKRYKELEKQVGNVDKLHKEISTIKENVSDSLEEILIIKTDTVKLNQQLITLKKDIDERFEIIKASSKNIAEYEINTKSYKENVEKFNNEIINYKEKIDTGLKQLDNVLSNNSEILNDKITEIDNKYITSFNNNEKKLKDVIDKNKSIQDDIIRILGKAIGTNLYEAFNEKAKQLKLISWIWLGVLIVSLITLTFIGNSVVNDLIKSNQDLDTSFYLRITVLFPILYAVYFFATQYKLSNKLQEEYDFKSAVSVSLNHFIEVVDNAKEDKDAQSFLTKSISNIFSSPTEIVFGKHNKDNDMNDKVDNTVEKIINMANSLISKSN